MELPEFDAEISRIKDEATKIREELEKISQEFLDSVKILIPSWYDEHAKSVTARAGNVERLKQMGREGIRALKGDVEILKSKVPDLVKEYLNKDSVWEHRGKVSSDSDTRRYAYYSSQPPSAINGSLCRILGQLAPVLLKYEILAVDLNKSDGGFSAHKLGESPIQYSYTLGFTWSEEMKKILERYRELYQKLIYNAGELKNTEFQKKRKEAENLWDEV